MVVACDDGDIISYSARSISLAIERVVPLADPWFLRNVGASAWGLAIHKEARLLAVSSNTHRVDVFAPALWAPGYREGCNHGEDPDGGYFREPSRRPAVDPWFSVVDWTPGNRYDSTHISLLAHDANIPNIAFCNTDLDPEGRYLLSTDIDGYTFVWDIYRGVTVFSRQGGEYSGQSPFLSSADARRYSRMGRCLSGSAHCEGDRGIDRNLWLQRSD